MLLLSIDPSINNLGACFYDTERKTPYPFLIKIPKSTYVERKIYAAKYAVSKLQNSPYFDLGNVDVLIIEYPNFQTSDRGLISAQKGYTIDLAFIIGYLVSAINPRKEIAMPFPIQWKGHQPKEAIGYKFEKKTGLNKNHYTDHEWEATMMIYWYLSNSTSN